MSEHYQSRSSRVGRDFESAVEAHLVAQGSAILERKAERYGIEIDIICTDRTGRELWVECKGGYESPGGRDGGRRTDNVLKFCGALWQLDQEAPGHPPYVLAVSALPETGRPARWIANLRRAGVTVWVFPLVEYAEPAWPVRRQEDDAPYHWPGDES